MTEPQFIDPSEASREKQTPEPASPMRTKLIVAGVGLVLVAAAYGVGRAQSMVQVDTAQAETIQAQQELAEREQQLKAELQSARDRAHLLEARRKLSQTLLDLERRNFGTASKDLQQAGSLLSKATKDAELAQLAKTIAAFQLVASEDVGEQRMQIIQWLSTFDERVPPPQ